MRRRIKRIVKWVNIIHATSWRLQILKCSTEGIKQKKTFHCILTVPQKMLISLKYLPLQVEVRDLGLKPAGHGLLEDITDLKGRIEPLTHMLCSITISCQNRFRCHYYNPPLKLQARTICS